MKNDFERQWDQLSYKSRNAKCPKTDEELDREISQIVANGTLSFKKWPVWFCSMAAACMVGIVVAVTIFPKTDYIPEVNVNGAKVYYLSNSNCSAENTIEMFNSLIH